MCIDITYRQVCKYLYVPLFEEPLAVCREQSGIKSLAQGATVSVSARIFKKIQVIFFPQKP